MSERELAQYFLIHLANATRKIESSPSNLGMKKRIGEIEKEFNVLEKKIAEYMEIKKERKRALGEIKKVKKKRKTKGEKIKTMESNIIKLEKIYKKLKTKNYPKTRLKKIKERIDFSKHRLKHLKS